MNGNDDKPTFDVSVDTFVNYKDESLMQRTKIAGEVQETVMRVREAQTVEALKMLGWHAPDEIPAFSDAACLAAQDVFNTTPVVFGERARRMRAALIAAFSVHIEEMRHAVEQRAAELEAKYAPKKVPPPDPMEAVAAVEELILYVRPDGTWRTSDDREGDLEQWRAEVDDHGFFKVPLGAPDELLDEVALMAAEGIQQPQIDDVILHWLGGQRG